MQFSNQKLQTNFEMDNRHHLAISSFFKKQSLLGSLVPRSGFTSHPQKKKKKKEEKSKFQNP